MGSANNAAAMAQAQYAAAASSAVNDTRTFVTTSFQGQIYISDQLDVQDTPIYDTITYTAGQTITTLNSQFFTNVGGASGKNYVQTNLTQSQKLVAPEAFSVFGLRLKPREDVYLPDWLSITNGFVFEMYLGQKWYQRARIEHFSAGMGAMVTTTNTSTSVLTNGWPSRDAMHKLAIPLVISNQLQFYAQLFGSNYTLSALGTGFTLVCEAVGLYARGVQ